jgi:hypothetical protein
MVETEQSLPARLAYDLAGLTLRVTAPDSTLCTCLESILAPLAMDVENVPEWEVRIRRDNILPKLQAGGMEWEGDLPEGLPAAMRRNGTDANLLVHDHLSMFTDTRNKIIDVIVRPGFENTLHGTPSISIVAEIIRGSGHFLIHSACLLLPATEECLLIFAPSGAGKTTTSLALARNGWRLVGDDATILNMDGTETRAWALPRALNVHRQTEQLLPWLADATNPWDGKVEQSVPLCGVAPLIHHATPIPRRCRATVVLGMPNSSAHLASPLSRSDALLRILADNLRIPADGMGEQDLDLLDSLAALVKQTTVLQLSVGPDLESLGAYLAERILGRGLINMQPNPD